MALIVVLSVMNGFEEDIKAKLLGTQSHLVISHYEGSIKDVERVRNVLEGIDGAVAATPFILAQGLISSAGGTTGAVIRGIEPKSASRVIRLKEIIVRGSAELDDAGILIGSELASSFGILVGDAITLVSPMGKATPLGMIPASRTFIVRGVFSTGMYEFDNTMVYITLDAARKLFMKDGPNGVEVKVKDIYKADEVGEKALERLGEGYWAKTWMDMNKSLFSALRLEKTIMFIILLFIILVAAFSIVSTLIMMVMEKRKEIAILKSMGATTGQILKIFVTVGMTIGTVGTATGLALGLLLARNMNLVVRVVERTFRIQVMPKDVYYITGLPTKVDAWEVSLIVLCSLVLCFVAAIYPARQAARQDPVEVIRYEA